MCLFAGSETHFRVVVVSNSFEDLPLIKVCLSVHVFVVMHYVKWTCSGFISDPATHMSVWVDFSKQCRDWSDIDRYTVSGSLRGSSSQCPCGAIGSNVAHHHTNPTLCAEAFLCYHHIV